MEPTKTFSRNKIYEKLSRLERSQDNNSQSSATNSPRPTHNILNESNLIEFFGFVSKDYHLNCSTKEARNGSSHPLYKTEYANRVQQRTIPLLVGRSSSTKRNNNDGNVTHLKKYKQSKRRRHRHRNSRKVEVQRQCDIQMVTRVNVAWNTYFRNLIQPVIAIDQNGVIKKSSILTIISKLSIEDFVGAHVQVKYSVAQHSKNKNNTLMIKGVLISANNIKWTIAVEQDNTSNDSNDAQNEKKMMCTKTILAVGSTLSVLLPSTLNDKNNKNKIKDDTNQSNYAPYVCVIKT